MLRGALVLSLLVLAACQPVEPPRPEEAPVALRRADAAFARADYEGAIRLYNSFLQRDPPEDLIPQASYKLALAHYRLRHYSDAELVLNRLRSEHPGKYPQVLTLYGDIDAVEGRNISALLWWDRAWSVATPAAQSHLSSRVSDLAPRMSEDERRRAEDLVHNEAILRALEAPPRGKTPAAIGRLEAIPTPTVAVSTGGARIGVLLPLSGRYGSLGQQSLEGMQLAVTDPEMLVVRDTASSAGGDLGAFEELIQDPDVIAIIGPLRSDAAAGVAPRAQGAGVPVLLLSQRDGYAGRWVFDFGVTRRMQADALARWAIEVRGLNHLAVAYPDDAYGNDFREAFSSAVTADGGRVLGSAVYTGAPETVDGAAKELSRWDSRSRLDAVFVPDGAEVVARIAPRFREALPSVQLLGTSAWNDPAALQSAGVVLSGSVFADGFLADSERPATRQFVEQFRLRYGRRPGAIEAQAYDAASLAGSLIARGARTRTELRNAIADAGSVPGAAGDLQIRGGNVHRDLFLLRVFDDGSVVEIQ